ncbi:MAG: AMP-binding protein [Rivularia sp. (in: Bacteria)]|nr:AMP-binding protein [Rivularia sp. MS3]
MLNLSIANLIKQQPEKNPLAICIATPKRKPLTYGSLHNCIQDVAGYLTAMGLKPNDRVAIALPNGSEMAGEQRDFVNFKPNTAIANKKIQ